MGVISLDDLPQAVRGDVIGKLLDAACEAPLTAARINLPIGSDFVSMTRPEITTAANREAARILNETADLAQNWARRESGRPVQSPLVKRVMRFIRP
jgi:hypothetical protein